MVSSPSRIGEVLAAGSRRLEAVSDSPRLDAEVLLARAIDMPRSFLYAHPDDELDAGALARFDAGISRRAAGEPLAYISGRREFWSLELLVTPATLVPRPETELLVEQALRYLPRRASVEVLDLGTGSGAIAIALARERPLCRVTATDASEDALAVARENARQLDVTNVEFVAGSWTAPLAGRRFDVIVSNPPYVAAADPALESLAHEPWSALVAGAHGLDAIRVLTADCPAVAADGAVLLVEHGTDQAPAVRALFEQHGWQDARTVTDYAGLPRVTLGERPRN